VAGLTYLLLTYLEVTNGEMTFVSMGRRWPLERLKRRGKWKEMG
jgi:hypothetical protein